MLPQFGFTEFLLIAVIALIVVGPRDLPMMMRKLGQFVAKGKAMARDFQSAFDDIAKQAELDDLRKEIEDLRRNNAISEASDELRKVEDDINKSVMMKHPSPPPKAVEAVENLPASDPRGTVDETASALPEPEPAPADMVESKPAPKPDKSDPS